VAKPLTHSKSWANHCALSRTELGLARVQRLSWPKSDKSDFGWARAQEATPRRRLIWQTVTISPSGDSFTGFFAGDDERKGNDRIKNHYALRVDRTQREGDDSSPKNTRPVGSRRQGGYMQSLRQLY
jgi:hypothetical protein